MPVLHQSVTRAAAWRLCTELARRHPESMITEQHAGGGLYDEVVLHDPQMRWSLRCNVLGSIHAFPQGCTDSERWDFATYLAADPRQFVRNLELRLRLAPPLRLPSTGRRQITYRVLAELMTREALRRRPLHLLSGFADSSGDEPFVREDLFDHFRHMDPRLLEPGPADPFGEPTGRFWFLIDGEEPVLAFEVESATVWLPDRLDTFDLMRAYAESGRRLDTVMSRLGLWRTHPQPRGPKVTSGAVPPVGEDHHLVILHYHYGEFAGWWTYGSPRPVAHYVDEDIRGDGIGWVIDFPEYTPEVWEAQCAKVDGVGDENTDIRVVSVDEGTFIRPPAHPSDLPLDDPAGFDTLLRWYGRGEATEFDVYAHFADAHNASRVDREAALLRVRRDDGVSGVPVAGATWAQVEAAFEEGTIIRWKYQRLRRLFGVSGDDLW